MSDWIGHAQATLERGGYRLSAPRAAVVATLADLRCSVTAKEIADTCTSVARTWAWPATSRSTRVAIITTTSSA